MNFDWCICVEIRINYNPVSTQMNSIPNRIESISARSRYCGIIRTKILMFSLVSVSSYDHMRWDWSLVAVSPFKHWFLHLFILLNCWAKKLAETSSAIWLPGEQEEKMQCSSANNQFMCYAERSFRIATLVTSLVCWFFFYYYHHHHHQHRCWFHTTAYRTMNIK